MDRESTSVSIDNDLFHDGNNEFWGCVENELQTRLIENIALLSKMSITIPDHLAQELREHISTICKDIEDRLGNKIDRQKFFTHSKLKNALKKASAQKVNKTILKWTDTSYRPELPTDARERIITWLRQIENIKKYQHYFNFHRIEFYTSHSHLSIFSLLILLFNIVYLYMNPKKWCNNGMPLYEIAFAKE